MASFLAGVALLVTGFALATAHDGAADNDLDLSSGTGPAGPLSSSALSVTDRVHVATTPSASLETHAAASTSVVQPAAASSTVEIGTAAEPTASSENVATPTGPIRDDFDRQPELGWGQGPLGDWHEGGPVANGLATIIRGNGGARLDGLDETWSLPIEMVIKQSVTIDPVARSMPESHFGIITTYGYWNRVPGPSISVGWVPYPDGEGDTIGLSLVVDLSDSFGHASTVGIRENLVSDFAGAFFWTRVIVDQNGVRARAWMDGQPEPKTWQIDAAATFTESDLARLNTLDYSAGGDWDNVWAVDLIEVERGLTGNP